MLGVVSSFLFGRSYCGFCGWILSALYLLFAVGRLVASVCDVV